MIRKSEVVPYYKRCCAELERVYESVLRGYSDSGVEELCTLRGYVGEEQAAELRRLRVTKCVGVDYGSMADELGLLDRHGYGLLEERFVLPVRNVDGGMLSLVGYYPDQRRYITVPAPFFSKECLLFNFDGAWKLSQSEYWNGMVVLVEGLFDCISLQAIGVPAVAAMGATVGEVKCEWLKLFRKVLAIPDGDETGRKSLLRWRIPMTGTMVKLIGRKDMDDVVTFYEPDSVRDMIHEYRDSREDFVEWKL